ncbi:MAG: helix-turn-helix domain-containing protein [Alicyclobacillaceae bacterium]|nr:helix-turn-helix domain-containing protein [Alicyclobacillaceae bacterium]
MQKKQEIPIVFTCKELQEILGISRSHAYQIMRQGDFPVVEVSPRKHRIYREAFMEWLSNKSINTTTKK